MRSSEEEGGQKGILVVGEGGRGGENGFTMRGSARTAGFERLVGAAEEGRLWVWGRGLDFLGGFCCQQGSSSTAKDSIFSERWDQRRSLRGGSYRFFGGCVMSEGRRSRRDGGDRRRSVLFLWPMGGDRGLCGLRDHRRWRDRRGDPYEKAREGAVCHPCEEVFLFFRGDPSGEIIIRRGSGERARRGAIGGRERRILRER